MENIIEENHDCWECKDEKFIDIGEFDDVRRINCPFCNPKISIEEAMDDNS